MLTCTNCLEEKPDESFRWSIVGSTRRRQCKLCDSRMPRPEGRNAKKVQNENDRRARRLAAGLCRRCGKAPKRDHADTCGPCGRFEVAKQSKRNKRLKAFIFDHYGSSCSCCGEATPEFLTIDHINGGGHKHRKGMASNNLYLWLIRNGMPEGFRTLCFNCNCGRSINGGICPHQIKKEVSTCA